MTEAGQARLPLLWDAKRLALPQWDGQAKGVFQTQGQPALRGQVVEVAARDGSWLGQAFITAAWESDAQGATAIALRSRGRTLPAVVESGHATLVNFDLAGSVEAMLFERYRVERRPWLSRCPIPYRHVIPRALRVPIKRAVRRLRGGIHPARFPTWPQEPGLLALVRQALGAGGPRTWPDGKRFALALTHDVESADGLKLAEEVAKLEADHGMASTWFILGRLAGQARGLADRLKAAGHEIGLHGVLHDLAFPFLPRAEMEKRLDSCASFVADYGVCGFRSPALLRSDEMYAALGERFAYDSSAVDTGRLTPHARPTGCCALFPFRRGGVTVAPITLPLDSTLLALGHGPADMPGVWAAKVEFVARHRGAAVLATHPEPHLSGNAAGLAAYARFLDAMSGREDAWRGTLGALVDTAAQTTRQEVS